MFRTVVTRARRTVAALVLLEAAYTVAGVVGWQADPALSVSVGLAFGVVSQLPGR